ncbi:large subunit ribosomal protein L18e [Candidatus Methanophagaceae archaeon]|nr:large subunit ribosomal protein L18e [Methanophagales archaeon]
MQRKKKTDPRIDGLVDELKKIAREKEVPIWRDIAKRLEKPRGTYAEVNLSKINRYSKANDQIVVPGKVLSAGVLDKPVTVAALSFSKKALEKISAVEGGAGKCMGIEELARNNPKGSGVKIII